MDGDNPGKSRRGFIWAGIGAVVGIAASQLYEMAARLDERLPSIIRERYRADMLPYLDQIKTYEGRITGVQSELSNMGFLETEYSTELQKAYEDLDATIAGAERIVNKYKPILGSDALLVEEMMLDLLKKHRIESSQQQEQISQLNSQINALEDRTENLEGENESLKKYKVDSTLEVMDDKFVLDSNIYYLLGCSYIHSRYPWMEFIYYDASFERDLKIAKGLGVQFLRIGINYQGSTGNINYSRDIRDSTLDEDFLNNLLSFLVLCHKMDIRVIALPLNFLYFELYTEEFRDVVSKYLESLMPILSKEPAIAAYSIVPEPEPLFESIGKSEVLDFTRYLITEIRKFDTRPITVAAGNVDTLFDPEMEDIWKTLDYISFHHYNWPNILEKDIQRIKSKHGEKPIVLEEFGKTSKFGEKDQKQHYSEVIEIITRYRLNGGLFWTLMDLNPDETVDNPFIPPNPDEKTMGIINKDYEPKLSSNIIRDSYLPNYFNRVMYKSK